jgi:D-tyrosyl-tRNA(Tyr) deacylase
VRAVVQRVRSARIAVGAELVGEMGAGLLALVGVGREDTAESAGELAQRIVGLRIFNDDSDRMNRSLLEADGTLGVVSQFTLFGDARHGRRPSYMEACPAEQAAPLIEALVEAARELGAPVVTGRFQADMEVSLVNSGPVTILLDTERVF